MLSRLSEVASESLAKQQEGMKELCVLDLQVRFPSSSSDVHRESRVKGELCTNEKADGSFSTAHVHGTVREDRTFQQLQS